MKTKKVGSLTKKGFSDFTETQCQRQLYIRLGEQDPRWIRRDVEVRQGLSGTAKSQAELGKSYEQQVYRRLQRNLRQQVRCQLKPPKRREVIPTNLSRESAMQFHKELQGTQKSLVLLEHEWPVSDTFVRRVFGQEPQEALATLGNQKGRKMRPDIMVIGNTTEDEMSPPSCLLSGGSIAQLSEADLDKKIGIAMFDIKNVPEERIGRRHLSELLFYAQALADWLQETGLHELFFVRCNGHGIFGYLDEDTLHDIALEQLTWNTPEVFEGNDAPLTSPLIWDDTSHLFDHAQSAARSLWQIAQKKTELNQVPLCIQAACGRCPFIDDCISTLKGPTPEKSETWDIRLIPYLQPAVAEQLGGYDIRTTGELLEHIDRLDLGTTPVPLHAELPSLKLRAEALVKQTQTFPKDGHLSLALPKYIGMALMFDFEVDQRNELVFSFGFYLDAKNPPPQMSERHEKWWGAWREVLRSRSKKKEREERGESHLQPVLDSISIDDLREDWSRGEKEKGSQAGGDPQFTERLAKLLQEMETHLVALEKEDILTLRAKGETCTFGSEEIELKNAPLVRCQYSYVSGGTKHEHEFVLLRNLIEHAHRVMRICSITELATIVRGKKDDDNDKNKENDGSKKRKPFFYRQNFAGFYWSVEQIEHLRALIERHLPSIQEDTALSTSFYELVDWMTPADSGVQHHALHKKMYDLRAFVETSVGLPQLINYTWHGTVSTWRPKFEAHPLFWAPHFNQMDPALWYEAIEEIDTQKRAQKEGEVRAQMEQKMRGLHEILRKFHLEAKEVLPSESKTISSKDFHSRRRNPYHRLGALWQGYHQLNAAASAFANDASRLTWPEKSIAKLQAGEVSELVVAIEERGEKEYEVVTLSLLGLSSHMKISEKNRVLLLHRSQRDSHEFPYNNFEAVCQFEVETLLWDAPKQGYQVTAFRKYKTKQTQSPKSFENFSDLLAKHGEEGWFLYPTSSDIWTGRLATNKDALLRRYQLGKSWLAERLLFLLGLGGETLHAPKKKEVTAAEIYAFAPQLLPPKRNIMGEELLTPVKWAPDPSQRQGILQALSHPIFCLQGPPGTGKSQTIIALIDEFLERHKGPARILVSAFSYSALEVVAQKLLQSRYGSKEAPDPTKLSDAARLPILYASSSFEEDKFPHHPEQHPVMHLLFRSTGCELDGERVNFRKAPRKTKLFERIFRQKAMEDTQDSFVFFANAHSLYNLGLKNPKGSRKYLDDDFGFDLIIIDEASQMPANYLTAIAQVVKPFKAKLCFPGGVREGQPIPFESFDELHLEETPKADQLTHIVLVGDQEQLPPVQQLEPPRKLKPMLDSVFRYFLEVQKTPTLQLSYNYRSHRDIVECIRQLAIYENLRAVHQDDAYLDPIPKHIPPSIQAPWLRQLLQQRQVVSTLIHHQQWDTALSPFEARLTSELLLAFFVHKGIDSAEKERHFWQEDVGVVSPHNAHGRLIVRETAQRLLASEGPTTHLPEAELIALLSSTVYSVEKFQGSDRSLIIGSFGVSSTDRLATEETFLYDLNRFNVLVSRAKHKMVLICSQNYLDYVPKSREVMKVAARVREYAYQLCSSSHDFAVEYNGQSESIELRWMKSRGESSKCYLSDLKSIHDSE